MSDSIIRFVTDDELEIQVDWADLINIPSEVTNLDCDACSLIDALSASLDIVSDDIDSLESQVAQVLTNQKNSVSFNIFNKHHHDCRYFTRNQLKIPGLGGEVHWKNIIGMGNLSDAINEIEITESLATDVAEALSAAADLTSVLSEQEKQTLIDNGISPDEILPSKDNPFVTLEFITNSFVNQGFAKEDHIHYVFKVGDTTDSTVNRGSGRNEDVFGQAPNGPYDWSDLLGHVNYFVHRDQPELGQSGIPNSELNWVDETVKGKKVWLGDKHIFTNGADLKVEDDNGGSKDISSASGLDLDNEAIKIYKGLFVGENLNTEGDLVHFRAAETLIMGSNTTTEGLIVTRNNATDLEIKIDNIGSIPEGNILIGTEQLRDIRLGADGLDGNSAVRRLFVDYDYVGTGPTDASAVFAGSVGIAKGLFLQGDADFNGDLNVDDDTKMEGDLVVDGEVFLASDAGKKVFTGDNEITTDSGSFMVRAWTNNAPQTGFLHAWVRDFSTSSNFLTLRSTTAQMSADSRFTSVYGDTDVKLGGIDFGPDSPMGTSKPNSTNINLEDSVNPYDIYEDDFAYSGLRINTGLDEVSSNYHDFQYMVYSRADHVTGSKLSGYLPSGSENFGWVMSDWFRTTSEVASGDFQALHLVASKEYVDFNINRFADPNENVEVHPYNIGAAGAQDGAILAFEGTNNRWEVSSIPAVIASSFFAFKSNPTATSSNPIEIDKSGTDAGKNVIATYTTLSTDELWIEDAEDAGQGKEIIIKFLIDELGEGNFPLRIRAVDSTIDGQLRFDVSNLTAGIRLLAYSGNWIVI